MKKAGYFFSAFLPILIATLVQFIASFFLIGCTFAALIFRSGFNNSFFTDFFNLMKNTEFSTYIMLLYSVICIAFFGLWYYHSCGGDYCPKFTRTFSFSQIAGIVILVPGTQFFCSYLVGIISFICPRWLEQYEELLKTAGLGSSITLTMLCYSVLLAPVCEELIFRGVTMHLARRAVPFWIANLMQAMLFGLFHMNWIQGIYAFALGLILGYICEKGGSIYYSILLHMLFNFWGTILSGLLDGVKETPLVGLAILGITILSLSLGFALFIRGTSRLHKKKALADSQCICE